LRFKALDMPQGQESVVLVQQATGIPPAIMAELLRRRVAALGRNYLHESSRHAGCHAHFTSM
jgi:hypothetical protein